MSRGMSASLLPPYEPVRGFTAFSGNQAVAVKCCLSFKDSSVSDREGHTHSGGEVERLVLACHLSPALTLALITASPLANAASLGLRSMCSRHKRRREFALGNASPSHYGIRKSLVTGPSPSTKTKELRRSPAPREATETQESTRHCSESGAHYQQLTRLHPRLSHQPTVTSVHRDPCPNLHRPLKSPNPDRRPHGDVRLIRAKLPPSSPSSGPERFPHPTASSGRKLGSFLCRLLGVDSVADEEKSPSACLRLLQQVEGEMSTLGPSAQLGLCAARPLASGSRARHLVWKISDWARAGHLQLQAFGSQQPNAETLQLLEGVRRREDDANRQHECLFQSGGKSFDCSRRQVDRCESQCGCGDDGGSFSVCWGEGRGGKATSSLHLRQRISHLQLSDR
ncbi:hypothetical protein Q8A73_011218 [Channa argus]|nr:hypothetical protein Q8A73_011218 [Channa argus]